MDHRSIGHSGLQVSRICLGTMMPGDRLLDPRDAALVDRRVPPGHLSTYGYTDLKFPGTGRVSRS